MRLILIGSLLFISSVANAGQFGLERGETIESIRAKTTLTEIRPYIYRAAKLPSSHPAFDDYRLVITPTHGLCKIQAWMPMIKSDAYGGEITSRFSSLYSALESKYGSSRRFDFLKAGSIWDEPRDWMMGLAKKERTLAAFWDREEKSNLPEDMHSISIEATGVNPSAGLIHIDYEFTNFSECAGWISNQENSSL